MLSNIQQLDWDSHFFEKKVYKICVSSDEECVSAFREISKGALVYLFSPTEIKYSDFFLADIKLTYKRDLSDISNFMLPKNIYSWNSFEQIEQLESLAIEAGRLSRFMRDPHISKNKGEELYRLWMHNSLKREIALDVLVYKEKTDIEGMITIGKNPVNSLWAVNPSSSGLGIGLLLLETALSILKKNGFKEAVVATQGTNIIAQKLFLYSGLSLFSREYVYHIHT